MALRRSVSAGSLSLAPSDLPPPIRVSHSMTDGISAYAGEFGGFKVEGGRGPSVAPNLADSGGALEGSRD